MGISFTVKMLGRCVEQICRGLASSYMYERSKQKWHKFNKIRKKIEIHENRRLSIEVEHTQHKHNTYTSTLSLWPHCKKLPTLYSSKNHTTWYEWARDSGVEDSSFCTAPGNSAKTGSFKITSSHLFFDLFKKSFRVRNLYVDWLTDRLMEWLTDWLIANCADVSSCRIVANNYTNISASRFTLSVQIKEEIQRGGLVFFVMFIFFKQRMMWKKFYVFSCVFCLK
jgi:hypothetical protein